LRAAIGDTALRRRDRIIARERFRRRRPPIELFVFNEIVKALDTTIAAMAMMLGRVRPAAPDIATSSDDGIISPYTNGRVLENDQAGPVRYFRRTIFVVSRM
jgi:hypothetical protein